MDMKELLKVIGQRIRSIRKTKQLSQEHVAELAGLHPTYVSDIERGKVNASINSYFMVAKALKVSLSEIVALPMKSGDRNLDNEIASLFSLVKDLDRNRQTLFLSLAKGTLNGIKEFKTRKIAKS